MRGDENGRSDYRRGRFAHTRNHRSSDRATTGHDAIHDDDDRDDEQKVNQPTGDVESEKAECPQNDQHKRKRE